MLSLTYSIPDPDKRNINLHTFLLKHSEIKFVSLMGIDFLGNDTDERIPIEYFLKHMDEIFEGGVQTDGSSVNLPEITKLNDANVDFIIDFESNWFIDYNYDYIIDNDLPIGTLRIPSFLRHNGQYFCSRSVLKSTIEYIKEKIYNIIIKDEEFLNNYRIKATNIKEIYFTLGTELEFWVRTPASKISIEELTASEMLKESYWKRTRGDIRSGLEESLILLQKYGLEPEMGHKEVGGVKGKITRDGSLADTMEQLEIDWRFSSPLASADNEIIARIIIKEVFRKRGLEVTFNAKPIQGVAGNGKHMHIGIGIKLNNGKNINLFAPTENDEYLSKYGYGALMGVLKHWEYINPFITNSISAIKRLKPGFEAPVSIVASLGTNPEEHTRNRTVLIGLVRSNNPLSVRFELRAPNPYTNTYLSVSAIYLAMLDGIKYASEKNSSFLFNQLSKKYGEDSDYLAKNREYLTNKNIYDDYKQNEREKLFGKSPYTIWEIIRIFSEKNISIYKDSPLSEKIIKSFNSGVLNKWLIQIKEKEIPSIKATIISLRRFQSYEDKDDRVMWNSVDSLIKEIAKNSPKRDSIICNLEKAIETNKYETISRIFILLQSRMSELQKMYKLYRKNIIA